jgi:hypothetical protein
MDPLIESGNLVIPEKNPRGGSIEGLPVSKKNLTL